MNFQDLKYLNQTKYWKTIEACFRHSIVCYMQHWNLFFNWILFPPVYLKAGFYKQLSEGFEFPSWELQEAALQNPLQLDTSHQ